MSREYEKRLQEFAQSNKDFEGEGVAELIVDTGESFATSVAKQASTPATSERIQNTRRDPIQADEDQAIEVAEDRALRARTAELVVEGDRQLGVSPFELA